MSANSEITKALAWIKSKILERLPLSGGTMTGSLLLKGNPTANLEAATKQYVDSSVSSVVKYSEQTLSSTQQAQARTNIAALGKAETAVAASKWAEKRTISATGDATWSVSVDGSGNVSGALTLADSGATAGSYGASAAATLAHGGSFNVPYVTVDEKGRVTSIQHFALKLPAAQTSVTGNAATATKLSSARTFAITGGATGSVSSDLTSGFSIALTLTAMTGATSSAAGAIGAVPAPAAGAQGKYLRGDGTWQTPTNTTYSVFKAATASAAGGTGLVPAPAAGENDEYLRGDGTWGAPTSVSGNAGTATKLATARTIRTNLASTSTASFDGSGNVTPGVTGTLGIGNGGTGRTDGKALALATARTITVSGNASGSFSFDGSANKTLSLTVNTSADAQGIQQAFVDFADENNIS